MSVYQVYYTKKKEMALGLNTFEAIMAESKQEALEKFFLKFPKADVLHVIGPLRR